MKAPTIAEIDQTLIDIFGEEVFQKLDEIIRASVKVHRTRTYMRSLGSIKSKSSMKDPSYWKTGGIRK